jgi:hypothetical protein
MLDLDMMMMFGSALLREWVLFSAASASIDGAALPLADSLHQASGNAETTSQLLVTTLVL